MEQVYSKGAQYYDRLYAEKDYTGEIQLLISLLKINPGSENITLLDSVQEDGIVR